MLAPLGAAAASPIAATIGTSAALWLAGAAILVCNPSMLLNPAVRAIRARGTAPVPAI